MGKLRAEGQAAFVQLKGGVYVSQPRAVAHFIEQAATGALAAGQEKASAGVLANAK